MGEHITQYKWKILAWDGIRRDKKMWTLIESQWFDKKKDCITDFRAKMIEGYDVADRWGTQEFLLKRRIMPRKYIYGSVRGHQNHA
jgi:hypothetical protein